MGCIEEHTGEYSKINAAVQMLYCGLLFVFLMMLNRSITTLYCTTCEVRCTIDTECVAVPASICDAGVDVEVEVFTLWGYSI